jgi:hypothetical protein
MKIYFDTLELDQSNLQQFESHGNSTWWLTSPGSILKRELRSMGIEYHKLSDWTECGLYFIDVNGDPNWWSGENKGTGPKHILQMIPADLLEQVKLKKLRIVILADKEGGPMVTNHYDVFRATTEIMRERKYPKNSVLILQGNTKIEADYNVWLEKNMEDRLFDVQYSNHFGKIFFDNKMPEHPCIYDAIYNLESKDFNSLNRVYRPHRGAHLYYLAKNNLLDKGCVSCNQLKDNDILSARLAGVSPSEFTELMKQHYPLYLDGNWENTNAAWNYNAELYQNTLLTVITETIFIDNSSFVTEKIFKPIALGHPFLLIAGSGTIKGLEELGFKCDFLGFGTEYDSIEDPKTRFDEIHNILETWVSLDRDEKLKRIGDSFENIIHNWEHLRKSSFYHDALNSAIQKGKEYFNEAV